VCCDFQTGGSVERIAPERLFGSMIIVLPALRKRAVYSLRKNFAAIFNSVKTCCMKKSMFILLLLLAATLSSFAKMETEPAELVGCWSFVEFNDGFHWEKAANMKEGTAGYAFKSDGTLIKRHPKNWYEDPAVTFEDYTGTWNMLSPDMLELFYDFPDGRRVRESVLINSLEEGKMVWQRLDWEEITE
jgi:hypothetical protein